ncbi:hypothetical protein KI387_028176, partial [Taxus chinensis]
FACGVLLWCLGPATGGILIVLPVLACLCAESTRWPTRPRAGVAFILLLVVS